MNFYCTYLDSNYLAKGIVAIQSLIKNTNENVKIYVICMDELTRLILKQRCNKNVKLIPIHEIESDNQEFKISKTNRSLVEYYWTSTPVIINYLLERLPKSSNIIYFDADLFFMNDVSVLFKELGHHDVLIHKHNFSQEFKKFEKDSGIFNVGLIIIKNTLNGRNLIKKWMLQCIKWCYDAVENGKYGDQKYLEEWPKNKFVKIAANEGIGVAPWNCNKYKITTIDNKCYYGKDKIIFYHFHSLENITNGIILPSKHRAYKFNEECIKLIYLAYIDELLKAEEKLNLLMPGDNPYDINAVFEGSMYEVPTIINSNLYPIINDQICIKSEPINENWYILKLLNKTLKSPKEETSKYRLAVIISCYNSERFIEGKIENLIKQTIFNEAQLIFVLSGTNKTEITLIEKRTKGYSNIEIIKTKKTETVYKAWNRAIEASNAKYITNSNTDDRLSEDALEIMCNELDKNNNISLIYANCYITDDLNPRFNKSKIVGKFDWAEFQPQNMLTGCYIGPQPVWRSDLHKKYGLFEDEFISAGDYEFWCRCVSNGERFYHLSKYLGLYCKREDSIEHANKQRAKNETLLIFLIHSKKIKLQAQTKTSAHTIGNLSQAISAFRNKKPDEALIELDKCIALRPFHPEAVLQKIDYYLQLSDETNAKREATTLYGLTPKWDFAKNIYNNISHRQTPAPKTHQKISFCIITKNEEYNIGRCLNSLKEIENKEIIIVDTGSSDKTINIAKSYGAIIYHYTWNNDFSDARNRSLEHARGDWVMFLDADEELTPGSAQTLKEDMAKPNILGYRLPLENVGSPLNGCNYVPRLVRNAPGLHFIGKIHETIHASVLVVMRQWNMEQVIGKTKILHHGYKPAELERKNKIKRNLALYEEALEELPDEASIMMNYAHDLNHDGQNEKAHQIYRKILKIFEQNKKEHITPEVREQFIHNYGVFLAQHLKMKELSEVMNTRTARETGPVANVHYMSGLGLMNCNKFQQAIPELEASIEKAYNDTLAPSVPDVRTWKPKHLLANCHASVGNELKAINLWEEVIADCNDSVDPFHDCARFMSTLDRNKEAMGILLKGLKVAGDTQKIWELGCGIVNKDPELAEMSLEWTEEAVKHHPESDVTNVRRGESLMKNGRFAEATDYFTRLSGRGEKTATAAQLICKQLSGQSDEQDPEIALSCVNEVNGWIDILEKAPCKFDRELAEQLVR